MYLNTKTGCTAVGRAKANGEFTTAGVKKTPLLKFSLAVKDSQGETKWFDCQAWNPIATRLKDWIKKGEIYKVEGYWVSWTSQNGNTRNTLTVEFISGLPEPKKPDYSNEAFAQEEMKSGADDPFDVNYEDLPF